jgi:hypothetical protein
MVNRKNRIIVLCAVPFIPANQLRRGWIPISTHWISKGRRPEAYIKSQAGEGWVALPERYDDGGYTGGNMERPAFYILLEDIPRSRLASLIC